eukprot:CAMPEP_0113892398 /NCGR_PEP_ID=MMETSP0780_2-20120614/15392_1 /TAXON_ID=652834 /ORGANISM="Palpitomonas bilix" /LENGTH=236 /DNA_ID=CAMNT_0000882327 /DNA_START=410 /DNA_END=1120 /DNA_ORIENTATION=+ /assembly_acc=CAM_ASM_000599
MKKRTSPPPSSSPPRFDHAEHHLPVHARHDAEVRGGGEAGSHSLAYMQDEERERRAEAGIQVDVDRHSTRKREEERREERGRRRGEDDDSRRADQAVSPPPPHIEIATQYSPPRPSSSSPTFSPPAPAVVEQPSHYHHATVVSPTTSARSSSSDVQLEPRISPASARLLSPEERDAAKEKIERELRWARAALRERKRQLHYPASPSSSSRRSGEKEGATDEGGERRMEGDHPFPPR